MRRRWQISCDMTRASSFENEAMLQFFAPIPSSFVPSLPPSLLPYLSFKRHGGLVCLDVAKCVPRPNLIAILKERQRRGRKGGR